MNPNPKIWGFSPNRPSPREIERENESWRERERERRRRNTCGQTVTESRRPETRQEAVVDGIGNPTLGDTTHAGLTTASKGTSAK